MNNRLLVLVTLVSAVAAAAAAADLYPWETSADQEFFGDKPASGMLLYGGDYEVEVRFPYGGSSAEKAGVKEGDVITAVNGSSVALYEIKAIIRAIEAVPVGTGFTLTVRRLGEEQTFNLVREETRAPEALFPARVAVGEWGYITRDGVLFLPPVFKEAGGFSDGMANVTFPGFNHGYITMLGQSFGVKYFNQSEFHEGLASVATNDRHGYITRTGELRIPLRYSSAGDFSEGMAPVDNGYGYYYIDTEGEQVFQGTWDAAFEFRQGRALIHTGDWETGRFGYIDKSGELVIDTVYEHAGYFAEGLAAVCRDGKWGHIDREGEVRIPLRYATADSFSEGLAQVRMEQGGDWGYIDTTGKLVIPAKYVYASPFSEGLAAVSTAQGKAGFIDRAGKLVIPDRYAYTYPFHKGLAEVTLKDNRMAYVDKTGKTVWQEE